MITTYIHPDHPLWVFVELTDKGISTAELGTRNSRAKFFDNSTYPRLVVLLKPWEDYVRAHDLVDRISVRITAPAWIAKYEEIWAPHLELYKPLKDINKDLEKKFWRVLQKLAKRELTIIKKVVCQQ